MISRWKTCIGAGVILGMTLSMNGVIAVLAAGGAQTGQSQPPPKQTDKDKAPPSNSLTLDNPVPAANAEEDAAYKEFTDIPATDLNKRTQVGEALLQKYPASRYRPVVYSALTAAYLQLGQVQKMQETGEKAIALTPNDVQTLAVLGQTIARSINASTPEPEKQLTKAEQYSKKAIELTPTIEKPAAITDEVFAAAKNQTLAMAHSGLGLVYLRRGKIPEAIPELDQSVKIDPSPDPVNYYLLGLANQKSSHFDDAVAAYTKCAALPGSMQSACQKAAEEAKKLAMTQLSAPK